MLRNLCIMSEGRTECNYVKHALAEHFVNFSWIIRPITLISGKNQVGMHKGGIRKSNGYGHAIKQIYNTIITEKDATVYTTFFDLYGFPMDIPCFEESKKMISPYEKADLYEKQIKKDVAQLFAGDRNYNESKFIPYIQPYEFESFLFVNPQCSALELSRGDDRLLKSLQKQLENISNQFEIPEHINNSPETAPSKRIESLVPGFVKNKAGKAGFSWKIAKNIGIADIRNSCVHFNSWVTLLENYQ